MLHTLQSCCLTLSVQTGIYPSQEFCRIIQLFYLPYCLPTSHGHHLQGNITKLTDRDLPEPYNKIIQQLSKLSLEALNDDKLIFTFEKITEACADITAIPGAINGCGLLQAVEHFAIGFIGTTTTINFLHFSIQEYLAADHIAKYTDTTC